MDFPTFDKNATKPTEAVTITPPDFNPDDTRDAETRWLDQQWRDAAKNELGATHPLALNRDSDFVTADPYTT